MKKQISPLVHSLLDYSFTALLLAAPKLLKGAARKVADTFDHRISPNGAPSTTQVTLNPSISPRTQQVLDTALVVLPLLTSAVKRRTVRRLFVGLFLAGLATVLVNDWNSRSDAPAVA